MKKWIISSIVAILTVTSAKSGVITWGSTDDGLNFTIPFVDNNNATFSGYAYLFLLTGSGNTVSWDGSSWNLNGAEQLSYSVAGSLGDAGTFGAFDAPLADTKMSASFYYQVVLTTTPGSALLTGVNSGYWASTAVEQLANYNEELSPPNPPSNKVGQYLSQNINGSWAPVAAVPEPATMALFGLGGLALVIRRKMRKEA